jgi:AraC-like DNA-binding protein
VQLLLDGYAEGGPAAAPVGREAAAVRRVRDYIHACYADNISLDDLAALAGLGRFQLAVAFRREVGLPPHAYHVQVRVAAARRLLATGAPAVRVAAETGFADQSHMIRHFRRIMGITPGEYVRGVGDRPRPRAGAELTQPAGWDSVSSPRRRSYGAEKAARAHYQARVISVPSIRGRRPVAPVMLAGGDR